MYFPTQSVNVVLLLVEILQGEVCAKTAEEVVVDESPGLGGGELLHAGYYSLLTTLSSQHSTLSMKVMRLAGSVMCTPPSTYLSRGAWSSSGLTVDDVFHNPLHNSPVP